MILDGPTASSVSNQGRFFRASKRLWNVKADKALPLRTDAHVLANELGELNILFSKLRLSGLS